ncbi:MAG: hypothetical protein HY958_13300 [Bacteroidia bacterium]|nr:hypothetical protein [Bacteroidia bacterium]
MTLISAWIFAQTPQGINYQAVARDSSGNELLNHPLNIRFSIIADSISGTISWQETHSTTTNGFGLYNLIIGQGTSTGAGSASSFSAIEWGKHTHFLKVEIDGGSGYLNMGTTQMMSVPYALFAEKSSSSDIIFETTSISAQTINIDLGQYKEIDIYGYVYANSGFSNGCNLTINGTSILSTWAASDISRWEIAQTKIMNRKIAEGIFYYVTSYDDYCSGNCSDYGITAGEVVKLRQGSFSSSTPDVISITVSGTGGGWLRVIGIR